jgi:sterol desaturase/sphingolipid hydroxylase (fatty acid hydroxylase superfamily)
MSAAALEKIFGLVGTLLVAAFVLGLAESISSGAAGFWGGLPFWIICFFVLALVVYDFWDTCLRKKPSE